MNRGFDKKAQTFEAIMNDRKLKYLFGLISLLLLVGLVHKIIRLPGDLLFPGYLLGSILLIVIFVGCLIITAIVKWICKPVSYTTLLTIVATIAFAILHYLLYSPTLKIVVPKGFTGRVNLVLSNLDSNILTLDTNGIGYLTKWTFEKTYTPPVVVDNEGNSLEEQCVGFSPSNFWGSGFHTSTKHPEKIYTLSFEIVPKEKIRQKQYYDNVSLTEMVDTSKILTRK